MALRRICELVQPVIVSEMDKSWMHSDRRSKAYEFGVEAFLNFAVENLLTTTHIRCPCVKCVNLKLFGVGIIRDHVYFNGIDQSYKNWTFHGEPWEATTNASRNVEEDDGHSRYSFVSEEIDMDDNDFGDFGSDPYEFANVIGDGDQPVYPGCRKYTKLSALVKLYNLKAKHGMSDVCFTELLILQGDLLPEGNTIPTSMWKEGKDSILKEGVPAKVVWYFPPIPRFKRMFQSHETAKSLTWHAARKSIDGQMSHPADSPSWKLLDDKWPEFGNEPRNLRLALSSDGFNPHSSLRYKACPICGDDTPSHRLKNGHKICYIGHRKWLPINHPYRRQRAAFNGKPEYGIPPEPLTGEEVLHMVENGDRVCWKKKSIFFDLEYWKYLPVRHALDVMHIEKNVCDSIIGTLLEIPGKNKDGIAARLDLLNMGVKTRFCLLGLGICQEQRRERFAILSMIYESAEGYVQNRTRPEGCIAERYIAEEAVEFCTQHLSDVSTVGVPSSQKMGVSKPLSGCTVSVVDQDLLNQAHLYVLENTEEVLPYIEQHMIHIKTAYPKFRKRTKWLQDKHNSTFIQWLRFKVQSELEEDNHGVSENLRWLAAGPNMAVPLYRSYLIKGIKFNIKAQDDVRTTQNSGVYLLAHTMQVASAKDKNPILSNMGFYGSFKKFGTLTTKSLQSQSLVDELGFTLVDLSKIGHRNDQFVLASQVKQIFFIDDPMHRGWSVVLSMPNREYNDVIGDEVLGDVIIECEPFTRGMPNVDTFDELVLATKQSVQKILDPDYIIIFCIKNDVCSNKTRRYG
ncbi:hypothetical protein Prudu_002560 [Prunus dulcis]|uniref:Transposable element protein n=1 Tax=Prunus dulcis TaxID=3755 RepID=A0A4Y1QR26_PRUDU|nr:hypothetical protein Prudu_002560 [Prunus dulcis]